MYLLPCSRAKSSLVALLLILIDLAACASAPKSHEELAAIRIPDYGTNGNKVRVTIGERNADSLALMSGRHPVQILTVWSNGWMENNVLTLDVKKGHEYRVFAYELKPGQDPASAEVRVRTGFETFGRGLLMAPIAGVFKAALPALIVGAIVTAPLWVPIYRLSEAEERKEAPNGRP